MAARSGELSPPEDANPADNRRDVRLANRGQRPVHAAPRGADQPQDIAVRAGVSPATAANVVGQLLEEGVLGEHGQLPSNGGRPATLTGINAGYGAVVGSTSARRRSGWSCSTFASAHGRGVELRSRRRRSEPGPSSSCAEGVEWLLAESGLPRERLLGLGVGVPGLVEQGEMPLVHAPSIGWGGAPLATLLEDRTGVPAIVDNGAKALGCAEAWFGAAGEHRDVVACLIGTGVGASLIRCGELYRGAGGSAGEWGHTTVVLDGEPCRCGARGCLEAYVGAPAIAARWRRVGGTDEEAIEQLARAAEAGDPTATRALADTARYLGAGVADLINLINPARIVIGGWVGLRLGPLLLPLVREQARRRALRPAFERVALDLCQLGPDAVALGAATIVVDRFFAAGGRREAAHRGETA